MGKIGSHREVVAPGTGAISSAGMDSESHALALMAGWLPSEALGSGFEEFDHAIGCRVASKGHAEGLPRHVSLGLPAVREAVENAGLSDRERAETDVVAATAISAIVELEAGFLGHALVASNLLEVVGLAGLLPKGVLPPVKNTTRATLNEPVDLVLDEPRHVRPEYLIKTSSGFSGLHSACVLRVIS